MPTPHSMHDPIIAWSVGRRLMVAIGLSAALLALTLWAIG